MSLQKGRQCRTEQTARQRQQRRQHQQQRQHSARQRQQQQQQTSQQQQQQQPAQPQQQQQHLCQPRIHHQHTQHQHTQHHEAQQQPAQQPTQHRDSVAAGMQSPRGDRLPRACVSNTDTYVRLVIGTVPCRPGPERQRSSHRESQTAAHGHTSTTMHVHTPRSPLQQPSVFGKPARRRSLAQATTASQSHHGATSEQEQAGAAAAPPAPAAATLAGERGTVRAVRRVQSAPSWGDNDDRPCSSARGQSYHGDRHNMAHGTHLPTIKELPAASRQLGTSVADTVRSRTQGVGQYGPKQAKTSSSCVASEHDQAGLRSSPCNVGNAEATNVLQPTLRDVHYNYDADHDDDDDDDDEHDPSLLASRWSYKRGYSQDVDFSNESDWQFHSRRARFGDDDDSNDDHDHGGHDDQGNNATASNQSLVSAAAALPQSATASTRRKPRVFTTQL
eukprot:m.327118 g.327118  ORF g.327118 m.327118 type:complete len:446 (-) comp19746_c0_seq5:405-1742(-)